MRLLRRLPRTGTQILLVLTVALLPALSVAQTKTDKALIALSICNDTVTHSTQSINPSIVSRAVLLPLLFYRKVLSQQLSASCQFSPSCSAFGMDAIARYGAPKGLLLTADRLTRCNGSAHDDAEFYLKDNENNLVEDSPLHYYFKQ